MTENETKLDPYEICPTYESEHFFLRLVSLDDADDLLPCYSDLTVQELFNNDNCTDYSFDGTMYNL